ncbi:hypothetical protein C8R46DRAFT_1061176 [Mycena filopes]|nr:hypothetical protein C8R46DRAFT_1061176 [Mycena filopes]
MPAPHTLRRQPRESADARTALMARLPSAFSPPLYYDLSSPSRSQIRHLRAERSKPYTVRSRATKTTSITTECHKARGLGRGAFLKDETLRTTQGQVLRVGGGLCSSWQRSEEYSSEPPRLPGFLLRRECRRPSMDDDLDCNMPSPRDASFAKHRRCSVGPASKLEEDCEMPHCGITFERSTFGLDMDGTLRDQLCVQAADDMFSMFLDETCMEAVE